MSERCSFCGSTEHGCDPGFCHQPYTRAPKVGTRGVDVSEEMHKAHNDFYKTFGRKPDRLLLSPRKWVEFVNLTGLAHVDMDDALHRMRGRDAGIPIPRAEFMGVTVDIAQLVTYPEITAVLDFPGDTYRLAEIHRAEERMRKNYISDDGVFLQVDAESFKEAKRHCDEMLAEIRCASVVGTKR